MPRPPQVVPATVAGDKLSCAAAPPRFLDYTDTGAGVAAVSRPSRSLAVEWSSDRALEWQSGRI